MVLDEAEIAQVARVVSTLPGLYRAPTKRPHTAWEKSLVREYTAKFYPNSLQWSNVRVGDFDDPDGTGMYKFLRKWCDAIIYDGNEILIVEAKMAAQVGAISQLSLYCRLFARTPEFKAMWGEPVQGILLTTRRDEDVEQMCKDAGHRYEIFEPTFLPEYIRVLAEAKRRT